VSTALWLEGISAAYGRSQVLSHVDLVVPEGKVVALLGANGAGKTTLLNVAAGLLRPTSGRVRLHGIDVTTRPEHHRARLGLCLIPEGHGIFRQLSVRENLAMFVDGRGVADAIERAASIFPILGDRLGQDAGTLSGGQQQMLAVCRALVTEARTIMADELSVGLLRSEGRSLLIVEQYVNRALAMADYVYILHRGSVAFVGEPAQCQDEHVFEQYVGTVA
jgi:branched-chain amino acid transport system ATP-binding protein